MYQVTYYHNQYTIVNNEKINIDNSILNLSFINMSLTDFNVEVIDVFEASKIIVSQDKKEISRIVNILNLKDIINNVHVMISIINNFQYHEKLIKCQCEHYFFLLFEVTFIEENDPIPQHNQLDEYIDLNLYNHRFGVTLYGGVSFSVLNNYDIDINQLQCKFDIHNECLFFKPIDTNTDIDSIEHDINYINAHFSLARLF